MTVEESNSRYNAASHYLSRGFYETDFFDYIVNGTLKKTLYAGNPIESILYLTVNKSVNEQFTVPNPEMIYQKMFIRGKLPFTQRITALLVNEDQAMLTRKNFVYIHDVPKFLTHRVDNSSYILKRGSIFNAIYLNTSIHRACYILNHFGIAINMFPILETGICYEALLETNFSVDVLYGPNSSHLENLAEREFLKSDVHSGFSSFVTVNQYSVYDFVEYKKANRSRITSWLIIFKFFMRHGFLTPSALAVFRDIFQFVHYTYCKIYKLNATEKDIFYNKQSFCDLLFLRLFGNPNDVDSHIEYMMDTTGATNAIPFTFPAYYHMGFFTFLQLYDFFLIHRQILLEQNNLNIAFYGCFATHITDMSWSILQTAQNTHMINRSLHSTVAHTTINNTDWDSVRETSIDHDSVLDAIKLTQPYVMFGTKRLSLNELGNACRRIYLSSLPDKFIPGIEKLPNEVQFKTINLIRFLNSPRKEVASIARLLLNMKILNKKEREVRDAIRDIEEISVLHWFMIDPKEPLEAKMRAMKYGSIGTLPYNDLDLVKAKSGVLQGVYVLENRESIQNTKPKGKHTLMEEIYERRKQLYSHFNQLTHQNIRTAFKKKINENKKFANQRPTAAEEEELLDDVLLVTWFVQSPFYTANLYTSHVATRGKNKVLARQQYTRDNFQFLQPNATISRADGGSLNDKFWPATLDSLQNVKNNFFLTTAVPRLNGVSVNTTIVEYVHDQTNGEIYTALHTNQSSILTKDELTVRLLERASTSSIIIPFYRSDRKFKNRVFSLFRHEPTRHVYPMSSMGKIPTISGAAVVHLFEGYPLTLDQRMVTSSNLSLLSEEMYYGINLFRQFFNVFVQSINFLNTKKTIRLSSHQFLPIKSDWFSQQERNTMNSKLLSQFLKEKLPTFGKNPYDRVNLIEKFKNIFFESPIFKNFVKRFIDEYVTLTKVSDKDVEYRFLKTKFRLFTDMFTLANTRVKYLFDNIKISDLFDLIENQDLNDIGPTSGFSGMLPSMVVNWNVVDTFTAYEYIRLQKKGDRLFTPLQVFRIVFVFKEEDRVMNHPAESFVIDPENAGLFPKQKKDIPTLQASAARGAKNNEFYAPISGYITRALDVIAAFEYNERSPTMFHYATSRRARSRESLSIKVGSKTTVPYFFTGMQVIYDMDVRFFTTGDDQEKLNRDRGRQRLWSPVTKPLNTHMIDLQYDMERKQWYLTAKNYLVPGNVIGFIAGEVSPVEIFVESTDLYDPVDITIHKEETIKKAQEFSDYVSATCENIFDREELYPVDEFGWFQYTHTKTSKPVMYSDSVFEDAALAKKDTSPIFSHNALESRDITEQFKTGTVKSVISTNAYREVRVICGYEIDSSRFSNHIRYVRYTKNPDLANAKFKRVKRSHVALLGKSPELNYWHLVITRYVPEGGEIVALIPSENKKNDNKMHWGKLLLSGYPRVKLGQKTFGNNWNYPVKPVPIFQKAYIKYTDPPYSSQYSTSLPIFATRQISLGAIKKLSQSLTSSFVPPTESHPLYVPFIVEQEVIPPAARKEFYKNHKKLASQVFDTKGYYFTDIDYPANLIARPSTVTKEMPIVPVNSPVVFTIPEPQSSYQTYEDESPSEILLKDDEENEAMPPPSLSDDEPDTDLLPEQTENVPSSSQKTDDIDEGVLLEDETFGSNFGPSTSSQPNEQEREFSQHLFEDFEDLRSSTTQPIDEPMLDIFSKRNTDYTRHYWDE